MEIKPFHTLGQQIEAYLDELLEGEELEKFQSLLRSDPELAYEVERVRLARTIIKNEELRETLNTIQKEEILNRILNSPKKHLLLYGLGTLLAILLITIIVKVFLINSKTLYEENYTPFTLSPTADILDNSILYSYSQQNYQDVVNIFENTPQFSNEMFFYAGVSYLQLGQADSAIVKLRKVISEAGKGGDPSFLDESEYYIGFAYLKVNNVDYSDWYFSKIFHDMDHIYNDQLDKWFYLRLRILKFRKKIF
jgi:hypothetical protein